MRANNKADVFQTSVCIYTTNISVYHQPMNNREQHYHYTNKLVSTKERETGVQVLALEDRDHSQTIENIFRIMKK